MLPAGAVANGNDRDERDPRVTLCHNDHTITVSWQGAIEHLRHGDRLGPCDSPTTPPGGGEVDDPDPNDPEIQDPEIDDPDPDDPETQDPEIQDPEIQDPEEQDPEIQEPPIPGPQGEQGVPGQPGTPGLTQEQVNQLIRDANYCKSKRTVRVRLIQRNKGSRIRKVRASLEGKPMKLLETKRSKGGRRQWTASLRMGEVVRRGIYVTRITWTVNGKTRIYKKFDRFCYGNPNDGKKESMNLQTRIRL